MAGHGGGTAVGDPENAPQAYAVDQKDLALFMNSGAGKAHATLYDPSSSYTKQGDAIIAHTADGRTADATELFKAYTEWGKGITQTNTNWYSYANAVNANGGGEGDESIITGAAVGQRKQLLGALADAGNSTTPTPGLGVMGAAAAGAPKK